MIEYLPSTLLNIVCADVVLPQEYRHLMCQDLRLLMWRLTYTGFKQCGLWGLRRSIDDMFYNTALLIKGLFVEPDWELRREIDAIYEAQSL